MPIFPRGSNSQECKGPGPADPSLQGGDQADRDQSQQKAQTGLQGQCRPGIFRPAELTDRGGELGRIGHNSKSPDQADQGQQNWAAPEEQPWDGFLC